MAFRYALKFVDTMGTKSTIAETALVKRAADMTNLLRSPTAKTMSTKDDFGLSPYMLIVATANLHLFKAIYHTLTPPLSQHIDYNGNTVFHLLAHAAVQHLEHTPREQIGNMEYTRLKRVTPEVWHQLSSITRTLTVDPEQTSHGVSWLTKNYDGVTALAMVNTSRYPGTMLHRLHEQILDGLKTHPSYYHEHAAITQATPLHAWARETHGSCSVPIVSIPHFYRQLNHPDFLGRTPLFEAALVHNRHTFDTLLRHGANIGVRDGEGHTVVDAAQTLASSVSRSNCPQDLPSPNFATYVSQKYERRFVV